MPITDPWGHDKLASKDKLALIKELDDLSYLVSVILSNKLVSTRFKYTIEVTTCFFLREPFAVNIKDYLTHLVKGARLTETELIGLLIIIDRYLAHPKQRLTNQHLNRLNAHTLIGSAMVVAQKYFSDEWLTLSRYASVTHIERNSLINLEEALLQSIDYSLFTTAYDFLFYKNEIVECARQLEVEGKGPFEYYMTESEREALALWKAEMADEEVQGRLQRTLFATTFTYTTEEKPRSTEEKAGYSPRFLAQTNQKPKESSLKEVDQVSCDTPFSNFCGSCF